MPRNRIDEDDFKTIAFMMELDVSEVRRAVTSFFSLIANDARRLPFNNHRRIYSKAKFDEMVTVRNIPYIGRIGPTYSRYIKWRANESSNYEMARRSSFRRRWSQGEIEDIAEAVLSGRTFSNPKKLNGSDMFDRIWIVGKDGKKSAKQVLPKQTK